MCCFEMLLTRKMSNIGNFQCLSENEKMFNDSFSKLVIKKVPGWIFLEDAEKTWNVAHSNSWCSILKVTALISTDRGQVL